MPIKLTCPRCGKPFTRKPSYVAKAKTKNIYCSIECRRVRPDCDTLYDLYINQKLSSGEIAKIYGVHNTVPCVWLRDYNIAARSASEAKKLDMSRYSYEERLQITAASRKIISAPNKPYAWLVKRALGVQRAGKLSKHEKVFLAAIEDMGLGVIPQMAVGKFNIDLAIPDYKIAVEVNGGCWHNTEKKVKQDDAKRVYLESIGWLVLVARARIMPQDIERFMPALNSALIG